MTTDHCEKCDGTGWMRISVTTPKSPPDSGGDSRGGYDAVKPCVCRTAERAEEEKKRPGGFVPAGEWVPRLLEELSPIERQVHRLIAGHRGRAKAIKIDAIRDALPSLDARRVKEAVEILRRICKVPIAATKEPPYGYFIPETAQEAGECHDRLFREGIRLIVLSQLFRRDADIVRELEGQLRLQVSME